MLVKELKSSMVKSTGFSARGPSLDSQQAHGSRQPCITPALGSWYHVLALRMLHSHGI